MVLQEGALQGASSPVTVPQEGAIADLPAAAHQEGDDAGSSVANKTFEPSSAPAPTIKVDGAVHP